MTLLAPKLAASLLLRQFQLLLAVFIFVSTRPTFSSAAGATACTLLTPPAFASSAQKPTADGGLHSVDGIECQAVQIELPVVGSVTILEATASSQEALVDAALALDHTSGGGNGGSDAADSAPALNQGDPYGSVLWPSASAVASRLLESETHQSLSGKTVLEIGAGTGLVSIAAALGGADEVVATDYEEVPLMLLEHAAKNLNGPTRDSIETVLFDICDRSAPLPPADIVVAADIMYESKTGRATAHRALEAVQRGSRFLIGCSPGRPGQLAFLDELKKIAPEWGKSVSFEQAIGKTEESPRKDNDCDNESTPLLELDVKLMDLHMSKL
eukprot:CAMPEP_0183292858 /NCGR_PEP_ID=MMETSP0160_2-20130417/1765_1 /TAXON_ID=2839 ORGANISM="Odontella Sinensis, Strain Grunow 1884" /NCGR_SAMPLE_ID=MMETSP0160_2 /ASSEMBLY_ACC=CAM_ASM_000250 /LENGTH=328 /DNA_ID=CAMNT_0025453881 /DNA_START=38 /DNA_END=1024 /DNA_ORIENTATION=+